ncbi:HDOD domain-containing protein [bacterium]|nr:HDOD domain-containing protein [bacterium]
MTERKAILARINSVPSMPSVVMELRKYLNDPDVSFDRLAKLIEVDPGLTVNVLQLANSAYFGWTRTISSVKDAITRLGTNRVFQMVLCMSVAPMVRKPIKGYDTDSEGLWRHSVATAICAEQLVAALGMPEVPQAFTAGLLHDMGKIVLGTFVEVDDAPIKEIVASDGLSFNEAEQMVLGIDHAEVAAELLKAWNLPDEVVESARWHHQPHKADEKHRLLVDLVHVADFLCLSWGFGMGNDGLQYRLDEDANERLGVDVNIAEEVGSKVMIGVEELGNLFDPAKKGNTDGVQHPAR